MTSSPNFDFPYIMPAQSQPHVTHNEAIRALDALVQISLVSRALTTPPEEVEPGQRFGVASPATDGWAMQEGKIASWNDGEWVFYAPRSGWIARIEDEDAVFFHDGDDWAPIAAAVGGPGAFSSLGVNMDADETNRIAAKAENVLLDNEGGDQRLKINKATEPDSATQLFQTGYSGRAEIGLAGDDDLHVKVSADGSSWHEAMIVDAATGDVSLPLTTSRANLLINGDFSINQRSFGGGSLAAGDYGFDRWKAATGGASLSVSGGVVTLASGEIEQIVEPDVFGLPGLASTTVTISADDPSVDLAVGIGSASATIAAGSGRQSVTVTLDSSDTGALAVGISAVDEEAATFARLKLETGKVATAWNPRTRTDEEQLCSHYYAGPLIAAASGYATAGGQTARAMTALTPPVPMASTPAVQFTSSFAGNTDATISVLGLSSNRVLLLTQTSLAAGGMAWYGTITLDAEL